MQGYDDHAAHNSQGHPWYGYTPVSRRATYPAPQPAFHPAAPSTNVPQTRMARPQKYALTSPPPLAESSARELDRYPPLTRPKRTPKADRPLKSAMKRPPAGRPATPAAVPMSDQPLSRMRTISDSAGVRANSLTRIKSREQTQKHWTPGKAFVLNLCIG